MNELGIEITSICSFNCYFCGIEKREGHILPTEVFKRVVDEALELGYDSFVLTPKNGDVFCDSDVYNKLDYLKSIKVPYYFFTNLHLADPEKLIEVMSPVGKIYLSEYGKSDEEFESLTRRPRSFRYRVLKNAHSLGDRIEHQDRNSCYVEQIKNSCESTDIRKRIFCSEATQHSISSNGNVMLCTCGTYNSDLIVGNVMENSLKDVFTSNLYRDKIKYLILNGMDSYICQEYCSGYGGKKSPKQMLKNMMLKKE